MKPVKVPETKSDWKVQVNDTVVCIIDQDTGKMSVTNDIENVINSVLILLSGVIKTEHLYWIYRDSDRIWDGISVIDDKFKAFIPLRTDDMSEAIKQIKR